MKKQIVALAALLAAAGFQTSSQASAPETSAPEATAPGVSGPAASAPEASAPEASVTETCGDKAGTAGKSGDKASTAPQKKGGPDHPTRVDPKLFQTTASGLRYAVLKEGTGKVATPGTIVTVNYTGWLESTGEKFDSSLDRDQPFFFDLGKGKVIKGWDEGVTGMKVGEKRQLQIPAELGYGSRGAGGKIPPGANLVFDVELLRVDTE